MDDSTRAALAKLDALEPNLAETAGPRELAQAFVAASTALGEVLGSIEERLIENNQLLHDMIRVLSSTEEPD
jgi:hypothetical protein